MKWLIVPIQNFSPAKVGARREVTLEHLPLVVRAYLKFFKNKVHVVHDEISLIKCTQAMPEHKKSTRSRLVKCLTDVTESRCGLTGTLVSKSPLNLIDPYKFLDTRYFPESPYQFAEKYCVMMSLRTARGRRVMISQKEYTRARKRLATAYKIGGEESCKGVMQSLNINLGLTEADCKHILLYPKFTPYKNMNELMSRVENITMTVTREDLFNTELDRMVYNPISRKTQIGTKAKKLASELVKLGFTDNLTLGKAAALELMLRLQDIYNGFEPIKAEEAGEDGKYEVSYQELPENPKLDALMELLEEIDTEQNQVVIWCHRRNAFSSIEKALTKAEIPFCSYSGSQSDEEKAEAEQRAMDGTARVFLANPSAAAYGLNCLRDFGYMVWYSVDASVEKYVQAQHRILRGESKKAKFAYTITIQDSIEDRIMSALVAGLELLGAVNSRKLFE